MSYGNYSLDRQLINSNSNGYDSDIPIENKVANEKEPISEVVADTSDQSTDDKVITTIRSTKTFTRKKANSNSITNYIVNNTPQNDFVNTSPHIELVGINPQNDSGATSSCKDSGATSALKIVDITHRNVVETKTEKKLHDKLKTGQRRRRYSDGASSSPKKFDESSSRYRSSQTLQSGTKTYDLNPHSQNNTNKPADELNASSQNSNADSSSKNLKSSTKSLILNLSGIKAYDSKKGALTKRKLGESKSDNTISKSPKKEIEIARKYLESLGLVLKGVREKEAVVYNRDSDRFCKVIINNTDPVERENCVKKILAKIKLIAEYELNYTSSESENDVKSFSEIVSHLENARWSNEFFARDSNNLKIDLKLTKNAIEDVKKQNILLNERSARLVDLLFGENLEESGTQLSLNDLSLIYPKMKIMDLQSGQLIPVTLPILLSKVWCLLIHLNVRKVNESMHRESEQSIKRLIEFCIKCFENKIGLYTCPSDDTAYIVTQICKFATPEMQDKLINAFDRTSRNAVNPGFYELFLNEINKDKHAPEQEIISLIAKSIVADTASKIKKVSLNELFNDIDEMELCPSYNKMSATIDSLSYIVAGDILSFTNVVDRRKVISFYVDIINKCIDLGDFASAYSLYLGFVLNPVSRLVKTWNEETQSYVNSLKELFDETKNYHNLFAHMNICKCDYFIIPPAIIGRKLQLINESLKKLNSWNIDDIEEDQQLSVDELEKLKIKNELDKKIAMRLNQRRLAREVLKPFHEMQNKLFGLSDDQILITNVIFDQKLKKMKLTKLSKDDLEKMSLEIEPKK